MWLVLKNKTGFAARNVIPLIIVLTWGSAGYASLIEFQSNAWDADTQHIFRDGDPIIEPATATLPDMNGIDFFYVEDIFQNNALGFSGAGAENPDILQHLVAYTLPGTSTAYAVKNSTGHVRTYLLTPEDFGDTNPNIKKVKIESNLILDGEILFVKESESTNGLEDMRASVEITVNKQTQKQNKKGIVLKNKKVLKGGIELKYKRNGKAKLNTSGKIRKKDVDLITENDNLYQIVFNEKEIPYKYKAKFGEEYSLVTELTSYAANQADGTGVEIIFGPWESNILKYQNNKKITPVIPEPPTIILLMTGSILMRRPRAIKGGSRLTIKSEIHSRIPRFMNIFKTAV
jgi:hypothetical protein